MERIREINFTKIFVKLISRKISRIENGTVIITLHTT